MPLFVVQRHEARTLHYDFRLEREGVFKSWAVPKGLPEKPGVRRLAIQVEDHSLAFGDFEGVIPEGEYGAGTVEIWDKGSYMVHEWTDDRIEITLEGSRFSGRYCMIRFHRKGEREWLLWQEGG
jgi:DNA ligase D-like protein (predicted 3'-phosphoesterase)